MLIEVGPEELLQFDERERGYYRRPIELANVHRIPGLGPADGEGGEVFRRGEDARLLRKGRDGRLDEGAQHSRKYHDDMSVWAYVEQDHTPVNRLYPIPQSYVDIILRGCLSISKGFALSFLEMTRGWMREGEDGEQTWVDDRRSPLYVRADAEYSIKRKEMIDALLEKHHGEGMKRRVVLQDDAE